VGILMVHAAPGMIQRCRALAQDRSCRAYHAALLRARAALAPVEVRRHCR
jgi:hypothetical protein